MTDEKEEWEFWQSCSNQLNFYKVPGKLTPRSFRQYLTTPLANLDPVEFNLVGFIPSSPD